MRFVATGTPTAVQFNNGALLPSVPSAVTFIAGGTSGAACQRHVSPAMTKAIVAALGIFGTRFFFGLLPMPEASFVARLRRIVTPETEPANRAVRRPSSCLAGADLTKAVGLPVCYRRRAVDTQALVLQSFAASRGGSTLPAEAVITLPRLLGKYASATTTPGFLKSIATRLFPTLVVSVTLAPAGAAIGIGVHLPFDGAAGKGICGEGFVAGGARPGGSIGVLRRILEAVKLGLHSEPSFRYATARTFAASRAIFRGAHAPLSSSKNQARNPLLALR